MGLLRGDPGRGLPNHQALDDFMEFLPGETERAMDEAGYSNTPTAFMDAPAARGVFAFRHPDVARCSGPMPSLATGGYSGEGDHWRLTDNGYRREWIEDGGLDDMVDTALAQAELQLQCSLTDQGVHS
ncbi:hypothetical protein ACFYN3_42725 [Streptomyces lavendulae]|uniref:hypothetical protein n=1 Tax=Streptomyces lavendulae TaxID=1914 RepID=UPI0036B66232